MYCLIRTQPHKKLVLTIDDNDRPRSLSVDHLLIQLKEKVFLARETNDQELNQIDLSSGMTLRDELCILDHWKPSGLIFFISPIGDKK